MLIYLISVLVLTYPSLSAKPDFSELDQLMKMGTNSAFPGGVVMVSNEKQIIYQKAYGYLTYPKDIHEVEVKIDTKYDVASITKVMATSLAFMNLLGSKFVKLDDLVSKYIPNYDTNKKGNTTIANLLLHNAGLPFDFPGKLPQNKSQLIKGITFIKPVYPIGTQFQYSNLGFIMLGEIASKVSGKSFEAYTSQNRIFAGLKDSGFNPPQSEFYRIAPTEYDGETRKRIIRGEAHERLAYLMGGIGGHSGYFTTASDLTKYMRMLLNGGKLPEEPTRTLPESEVKLFTNKVEGLPYPSTRAYGFDTHCPGTLMKQCFGHGGSTGILAFADKERKIVIVALTNRGHPNPNNNLFFSEYMPKIIDTVIKAIDEAKQ